jgi:hypothetical protein
MDRCLALALLSTLLLTSRFVGALPFAAAVPILRTSTFGPFFVSVGHLSHLLLVSALSLTGMTQSIVS